MKPSASSHSGAGDSSVRYSEPDQRRLRSRRILGRIDAEAVLRELTPNPGGLNGAFRRLSSRL